MLFRSASGYAQVPNLQRGMLPFFAYWPAPNDKNLGGGLALAVSNPPQKTHEDFGLVRFDFNVSAKDSLSANYLIDDGENDLPLPDPVFFQLTPQRSQMITLQQTHIFSPTVLNIATAGFLRGHSNQGRVPNPPLPASLSFIQGVTPGTITIGGTGSTRGAAAVTTTPGQNTSANARNSFTWADDVHLIRGKHSFSAGMWIQRIRANLFGSGAGTAGQVTYPDLLSFLQDRPTQFVGVSIQTLMGFRTTEAAWYVQDEIKLKPNLTFRMGLRDEMTSGWNEATGRCSNYIFDSNGVIRTDPLIGPSCLTQNNSLALWQPRVGLAWDPTGTGTWAVRAGFGIHNDLQDNLYRLGNNPPFNSRLSFTAPLLSIIPLPSGTPPPPACNAQLVAANRPCSIFNPSGVEPTMHTPTIQEWSLTVEREITKDLMVQLSYVGSQSYHMVLSMDANTAHPEVCANPAGCISGGIRPLNQTARVPQGTTYMPSTPGLRPNPYVANTSQTWWYSGNANYHGLGVSLVKRATRGLTFKTNYTFSKALDLNSATGNASGSNEPGTILNPFDLKLQKGVAAFSLRRQFNVNFRYELPFGRGQRWGSGASGVVDKLLGGWQWNGILTAQSGFPFTPLVGSNISGTGASENPDVPNRNPSFSGPVILSKIEQWFNPSAFLLPTAGTFGNVSRSSYTGPGLTTFDTSLFKKFPLNERWNLQFRTEVFNLFNHANFGSPNPVVFSGNSYSSSAGVITAAADSRQLQFALKLIF